MCLSKLERVVVVALAGALLFTMTQVACGDEDAKVRPAYFAGSWYPGDADALTREVDRLLDEASPPKLKFMRDFLTGSYEVSVKWPGAHPW